MSAITSANCRVWPLIALAVLTGCNPSVFGDQEFEPQEGTDPIPTDVRIMRRLAEAADGIRYVPGNPSRVYLIASRSALVSTEPERSQRLDAIRAYPTIEEALAARDSVSRRTNEEYGVFGPFSTEGRLARPRPAFIDFTIQMDDGTTRRFRHPLNGYNGVDAIFFTEAALDKFVYPYYSRWMTPAELEDLRRHLERTNHVDHYVTSVPERE